MRITKIENTTERLVLTGMIVDTLVCGRIAAKWQTNLFRSKWANLIAGWCVEYHNKYGKAPGKHIESHFRSWSRKTRDKDTVQIAEKFLTGLSDEYASLKRESNADYIIDKAGEHFSSVRIERLKDDLEADITDGNIEKAIGRIQTFDQVKIGGGEWLDVFHGKDAWKEAFTEDAQSIVKYPGLLGQFFGNQLGRDCFVAFTGPEKRGKSFILMDIAFRAALQRRRVAFFEAGDMSRRQILRRFGSRIAKRPRYPCTVKYPVAIRKLKNGNVTVDFKDKIYKNNLNWKTVYRECKKTRKTQIRSNDDYLRLSCWNNDSLHVKQIEAQLREWEREAWVPDVVCIAEGSLVLTDKGLVPIEKVTKEHKLWDGTNWVSHDGAVCKGVKEVIEYAGIEATPEHEVWTETGWRTLESCRLLGLRVAQTGIEGQAIRLGENYISESPGSVLQEEKQKVQWLRKRKPGVRQSKVRGMRKRQMGVLRKSSQRTSKRLSAMFATKEVSKLAFRQNDEQKRNMPKSQKSWVERLRRAWNRISIRFGRGCLPVDYRKFRSTGGQKDGNRQDRQQRSLRARKYPLVYQKAEHLSYKKNAVSSNAAQVQVIASRSTILRRHNPRVFERWLETKGNCSEMENIPKKVRGRKTEVWDILNAGPLHRFTVQGVLVHNCIDYADILNMDWPKLEGRERINKTWMQMRKLSQQYHCLVVTATQANAKSYDAKTLGKGHFSEDKRKHAHVTCMYGINQTAEEKEMGVVRLNCIELRDGEYQESRCVYVAGCLAIGNMTVRSCM